ncbi:hypothetical protein GW17_00048840 [Ensete ventricosum]|nr:hypothetical protein GW17_00048840 [Ensete ventricosum]RZR80563.1 hypothetical protein BHM03_00006628 [Ensete ventricosum]
MPRRGTPYTVRPSAHQNGKEAEEKVAQRASRDAVYPRRLRRHGVMDPAGPKRRCPSTANCYSRVSPRPRKMDRVLEALLALPDPSVAFELSLEGLLESSLLEAEKDRLVECAIEAASAILEAARRSARRRASKHNSSSWPLSSDLTIRVNHLDSPLIYCW